MWRLSEAAARIGGRVAGADVRFDAVGNDSRGDCTGQLFVALRGARFDAHGFVVQAGQRGAAAALVDHQVDADIPQLVVDDTRLGLGRLAAAWRERITGEVIAVTGSNGKTTCKEMIAAVLGQVGSVHATGGNLNNDIGLPLTLLAARDQDFLVLELGANHPGEIAYLTAIGRPDIAVITNAGHAHLEGFGSLEGVARAKGEIAQGLPADGTFIVPSDSPWIDLWRDLAAGRRVLTCGSDVTADVRAEVDEIQGVWDENGFRTDFAVRVGGRELELALGLAGTHNIRNALVAVAVARVLEVGPDAIRAGLAGLQPVPGRLCPRQCPGGLRLIDDSYNANPDSVRAAIEVLVGLPGRHWLVLGDLAELGSDAEALHSGLGEAARTAGVEVLYTVGILSAAAAEAFGTGGRHFPDQASLISALRRHLGPRDLVLVKGSRAAAMEQVADAVCGVGGA
ncbi:UDP-N-acetylmuramoyl-tripeptide--D-alanyl-D-alanine ligase [Candidatus Thiosymbion oneisti]|uniref:UDP-N-acetylmuramoyl-tripeptide--D-alanyl-D- alanine ligase n=1 Tax=Candidatus Thiosymbion oneisti TaxID=589554 RepID=UPI000B0B463F|nr:UDP-N-acetylmuramoyl-tripeptide--D-alanyl-D-alanine ligase [Candidatus Thiosymbion oneisti]